MTVCFLTILFHSLILSLIDSGKLLYFYLFLPISGILLYFYFQQCVNCLEYDHVQRGSLSQCVFRLCFVCCSVGLLASMFHEKWLLCAVFTLIFRLNWRYSWQINYDYWIIAMNFWTFALHNHNHIVIKHHIHIPYLPSILGLRNWSSSIRCAHMFGNLCGQQ